MARKPKTTIKKVTKYIPVPVPPGPKAKSTWKDTDLPARRAAFIDHYMVHYNGSRAAIEAGYARSGARQEAARLLANADIKAEIMRRRAAMAENLEEIANQRIQYELAAVGLANMKHYAPMFGDGGPAENLDLLTYEQAAAVQEITVEEFKDGRSDQRQVRRTKFKLAPKVPALELLAKTRGMLIEDKGATINNVTIISVLMEKIAAEQRGKPIVEVEAAPNEGNAP